MQSLLTRAAPAHICTCRACAHVCPNTAIRRTTTAVNRRRKPTFSDIFTAFYTTVLGTAAVLDAHYKDGRRKELDRKFEQARTNLDQLRHASLLATQDDAHHPATRGMRPRPPMSGVEALNSICKMDDALARHQDRKYRLYKFLRTIHRTYDPEQRLSSKYAVYLGANFAAVEAAVEQEASDESNLRMREPMTNTQFERYHIMINKMVDKLIAQSYYDELPNDPEKARRNLESLDSAWTAIRMLRSEGYPRYTHPGVNPAETKQARDQLAGVIRTLFDMWGQERAAIPKFQVAKLCYNFLVCSVPPSIHHYNMLLLGFMRNKMHNLVDIVIESLLGDSRFRPTTQTVVCLLLHYRQKKDIHGFYGIIRRMMAIDNRGMQIRRRWYEDVVKIPALHEWARQPEVTTSLKANWVIERPSRSQDVYEALVSGILGFGRVKDAVKVFVGSLQERIGTSIELFIYLLKHCLYTLDTPAADILLRGLVENTPVVVSLLLRSNCPDKLAEHLYPILNMGRPPSSPFSKDRARLTRHVGSMPVHRQDRGKMRLLTTALFIRQTETHLMRLDKVLRRARHIMEVEHPRARIDVAICATCELFDNFQKRHEILAGNLLKHQVLLQVTRSLEESTWDIRPGTMKTVYDDVMGMLKRHIPHPAEPGGYKRLEHMTEIREIADYWLKYRISKIEGSQSQASRMMLRVELALVSSQRLEEDAVEFLPSEVVWRSLSPSETEESAAGHDEADLGEDENAPVKRSLWPRTEARAIWAAASTGPAERVG